MKRLLLLVLIVLVAGAGGAAAWWTFLRDQGGEGEAGWVPTGHPAFVEFDPMVVPLIQDGVVTHHVTFKIVLEVDDGANDLVFDSTRQLTDAYLSELHGLFAKRFVRRQKDPLPLLRKRLLAVSDRLLGPGVVGDVLISELARRRPRRY